MNRRDFLLGAGTGAVVGAGIAVTASMNNCKPIETGTADAPGSAPAVARGLHEWKMVTTWPKNFPGLGTGAQRIAERIGGLSDGRLTIKLFAAGELVPAFEVFDAVRDGIAEISHSAPVYWLAKHKSTPFFGAVPSGLTQQEHTAWLFHAGGQALWDELYGGFGLKPFMVGATGTQMGGWFQKEINSLADFNGIKMRIPGLGGELINRLGGTAVNMPGGEILPALQSGVVDATEWVGPWNDLAFGFHQVAKYYYGPGFHEPNATIEAIVNKERFEALPNDLQLIVEHACLAESPVTYAEFTAGNATAQKVLVEEHGVTIASFPQDLVREANRIGIEILRETAEEDALARRIFDSWWKVREDSIARAPYAEGGFMRDRGLL